VRKLNYWFSIRTAIAAVVFVVVLETGDLFAQRGNIALFPPRNSSVNAQLQGPKPPVTSSSSDQYLERLDQAIEITSKRYMTANAHSPWQIFHGILALRKDCQLRLDNQKVNAIEWLSTAEPQFNRQPWMFITPHGAKFHPYNNIKYHFEGHPGQFLALLSESDLPLDHPIKVQGKIVTLQDVVNNSMKEVNSREEVTWVLWALQHYLKPDAAWVNQAGESWSIEKLVQIETAQPVVGAPCGGNHRLFALTRARDKYIQCGGRLRGVWLEADQKIQKHIEIARSLQNRDGSFSSDSYKGPNHTTDINNRFNTTGHTMEFLAISLPNARLQEPWVKNAVSVLSNELIYYQQNEIDAGPLFHTLDALILYRDRVRQLTVAKVPDPSALSDAVPRSSTDPTKTGQKSPQAMNTAPDKSRLDSDANQNAKSADGLGATVPLPAPNQSGVIVPKSKTAEASSEPIKLSVPRLPNPMPESQSRRENVNKSIPKLDPSQLNDVGEPAPPSPRTTADRIRAPRMVNRDANRTSPPRLLPETSARPLLLSETASDESQSCSSPAESQPKEQQGLSAVPGRSEIQLPPLESPATESKLIEAGSQTASALEPSNL
jgi:hypothetical protein